MRRFFSLHKANSKVDKEIAFHLDQLVEEYVAEGMPRDAAERQARLEFGGVQQIKEECRDSIPLRWLADFLQDVRFAWRQLARKPMFTAVCVVILALGVGANTAIFTLARQLLLKSLPVQNPEELVEIGCFNPAKPDSAGCNVSFAGFENYRKNNQVFSGTFAFGQASDVNVAHGGSGELASAQWASGNIYSVLGIDPVAGRLPTPADDSMGAAPVVVLSHAYWQRRFGGDAKVIGKTIVVNRTPAEIAGVLPPEFHGVELGSIADLTLALGTTNLFFGKGNLENAGSWWLRVVGRKKPQVTLAQVQSNFGPLFQRNLDHLLASLPAPMAAGFAPLTKQFRLEVKPAGIGVESDLRRKLSKPIQLLLAMTAMVFLIACANLAGLLFSRALTRRGEFKIRLGLGAGRGRLLRQILAETMLLSIAGGLVGAWCGWLGTGLLFRLGAGAADAEKVIVTRDWFAMLFAFALTMLTGLLLALGPASEVWRAGREKGFALSGSRVAQSRMAPVLVTGQIAFTVVLLVGSALFLRTLNSFRAIDAGFQIQNLITFQVQPYLAGYDNARTLQYLTTLVQRLKDMLGVDSVAFASSPIGDLANRTLVNVAGFENRPPLERETGRRQIGPGFLETSGLRLLQGRSIGASDVAGAPPVVMVNESFARYFFGGRGAVGKRVGFMGNEQLTHTIIGVFGDARERGPKHPVERVAYTAFYQEPIRNANISLRHDGSNPAVMSAIRDIAKSVDPVVPLRDIRAASEIFGEALRQERLLAIAASTFSAFTLLIVSIGLYGLLASGVMQRSKEIAIRLALGSQSGAVIALVVRQALLLSGIGFIAGALAASWLVHLVRAELYGMESLDTVSLANVAAILAIVTGAALYIPTRKAVGVDPATALRSE